MRGAVQRLCLDKPLKCCTGVWLDSYGKDRVSQPSCSVGLCELQCRGVSDPAHSNLNCISSKPLGKKVWYANFSLMTDVVFPAKWFTENICFFCEFLEKILITHESLKLLNLYLKMDTTAPISPPELNQIVVFISSHKLMYIHGWMLWNCCLSIAICLLSDSVRFVYTQIMHLLALSFLKESVFSWNRSEASGFLNVEVFWDGALYSSRRFCSYVDHRICNLSLT